MLERHRNRERERQTERETASIFCFNCKMFTTVRGASGDSSSWSPTIDTRLSTWVIPYRLLRHICRNPHLQWSSLDRNWSPYGALPWQAMPFHVMLLCESPKRNKTESTNYTDLKNTEYQTSNKHLQCVLRTWMSMYQSTMLLHQSDKGTPKGLRTWNHRITEKPSVFKESGVISSIELCAWFSAQLDKNQISTKPEKMFENVPHWWKHWQHDIKREWDSM